MNKLFMLLWILTISCINKGKVPDCNKFRNGSFFIKSDNGIPSFSLSRFDSVQYEMNNVTKVTKMYSVKWIGSCEYELRLLRKTENNEIQSSPLMDSLEKITTRTTILKTTDSYCVFEVKKEGFSKSYRDTMWIATDQSGGFKSMGDVFKNQ